MDDFAPRLLDWYDRHARALPWRVPPGVGERADPYHVWLSEVMLQQTTVAAVGPYFRRFLDIWPTVDALAAAEDADVMGAWAGLGYYSRARNLLAAARLVSGRHGGRFPGSAAALRDLPGVGDYTAAAIAAIAFGERVAVVDGNIERVSLRHMADATPKPKAKPVCTAFMDRVTPADRPGDFVQAMMDLGATICTPRNPVCGLCPVSQDCAARAAGTMLDYPVKAARKPKPTRVGAAFVAVRGDEVWLVTRPGTGMLGGMAAVPSSDWSSKADGAVGESAAPFAGSWERCGTVSHGFTHFALELEVWTSLDAVPDGDLDEDGRWGRPEGLPTLFAKAVGLAQAEPMLSR